MHIALILLEDCTCDHGLEWPHYASKQPRQPCHVCHGRTRKLTADGEAVVQLLRDYFGLAPVAFTLSEQDARFEAARRATHEAGLPWTDPRDSKTYPPPRPAKRPRPRARAAVRKKLTSNV